MTARNPYRPFVPNPELMALAPERSGNEINGLGEATPRRARTVYWALDPDDIPHGGMQKWFYSVDPDNPHLQRARAERAVILDKPISPVSGDPVERSPQDWTEQLAQFEEAGTLELYGVVDMHPDYAYEGVEVPETKMIVVGVAHDFDNISQAPDAVAGAEVVRQYGRAANAAKVITSWLNEQGWPSRPVTGPFVGDVLLIPPALDCGFGELGKHGSIINPRYGSSFRLSAILTDAPFANTPAQEWGIDDFCSRCRVCEDACPPEALGPDKQMVRGVEKWYVDFDKCLPFFNATHGCAICIAKCPWSLPGVGPRLVEKLARRKKRLQGESGEKN